MKLTEYHYAEHLANLVAQFAAKNPRYLLNRAPAAFDLPLLLQNGLQQREPQQTYLALHERMTTEPVSIAEAHEALAEFEAAVLLVPPIFQLVPSFVRFCEQELEQFTQQKLKLNRTATDSPSFYMMAVGVLDSFLFHQLERLYAFRDLLEKAQESPSSEAHGAFVGEVLLPCMLRFHAHTAALQQAYLQSNHERSASNRSARPLPIALPIPVIYD